MYSVPRIKLQSSLSFRSPELSRVPRYCPLLPVISCVGPKMMQSFSGYSLPPYIRIVRERREGGDYLYDICTCM